MSRALAVWQDFQSELEERQQDIADMLPQNVSKKRFISSAVAAVKQNPELLMCTQRSLFAAITKSAQDGLLPDGREGVISKYREKQKDNSYQNVAQWNPMAFGLRKRARELDEIIVDAQVVYENDRFDREQGDDPRIIHKPAPLGADRGKMVGAYAIFKKGGSILHREVMDAEAIKKVKGQSKAQGGLLWTKFEPEAWRKTVVRRGFKSVPCSDRLEAIVSRDDDMFAFDDAPAAVAPSTIPSPPPADEIEYNGPPLSPPEPEPSDDAMATLPENESATMKAALLRKLGEVPSTTDDLAGWQEEREPAMATLTDDDRAEVQRELDARFAEAIDAEVVETEYEPET